MKEASFEQIKSPRTMLSVVCDVVIVLMLIAMWITSIMAIQAYKDDTISLLFPAFFTFFAGYLSFISYYPEHRLVSKFIEIQSDKQLIMVTKLFRLLSFEIAFFGLIFGINQLTQLLRDVPDHYTIVPTVIIFLGMFYVGYYIFIGMRIDIVIERTKAKHNKGLDDMKERLKAKEKEVQEQLKGKTEEEIQALKNKINQEAEALKASREANKTK